MTVRVYRSTDASAPQLGTATVGGIIAILDACLVNGYGSKTAAGWTKPFSGTNIACYRTGAGSNQHYLQVSDNQRDYAELRGFEDMTAYNVGTNQFPTQIQQSRSLHYKWDGSFTGTKGWIVVADEKFMHLFNETTNIPANYSNWSYFGDIITYKGSDQYNTIISASASTEAYSSCINAGWENALTVTGYRWLCRRFDNIGTSQQCGMHGDAILCPGFGDTGNYQHPYPSPIDGGLWMTRCYIHETIGAASGVRGEIPGSWVPCHQQPWTQWDTFSGTGELAGKTFIGFRQSNGTKCFALEVSDTWYG